MPSNRVVVEVQGADELIGKLKALGADVRAARNDAAMAAADVWVRGMNDLAPGPHIEGTIHTNTDRKVIVEVGPEPDRWYYRFFELGAQPHEITPSAKKALAYEGFVSKRVRHPGMPARPFMRPVADGKQDEVVEAFGRHLAAIIERHAERAIG